MYRIIILPLAKADIKTAANWYNKKQQGLGKRFTFHIKNTINFIETNPKATAIKYSQIRTTNVSVFPFMIHYFIDEINTSIVVTAVFHTSQNPLKWKKR